MRMKTTAGDSLYADSPGQRNDAKSMGKISFHVQKNLKKNVQFQNERKKSKKKKLKKSIVFYDGKLSTAELESDWLTCETIYQSEGQPQFWKRGCKSRD